MKASHRLKISLSIIWALFTSLAIGAFFYFFEDDAPVIHASNYQIEPLDFTPREALLAQSHHSAFLYELAEGRYQLRFYHFQQGELVESGYLAHDFASDTLLIHGLAEGDSLGWQLNGESFFTADYWEYRRPFIGAGGIEQGTALEPNQPQVLFYFAHWNEREFLPVTLNFLLENLHEESAFDRFMELYVVTIEYLEVE